MRPEAKPNPLSPPRATPKPDPMIAHAKIWRFAHSLPSDQLSESVERTNYVLPILGMLAAKTDLKPRDVIKAASAAVAEGKVEPTEAVRIISAMPTDPDKLRPWMRNLYETNMTAMVHLKAAMMKNATPPAAPSAALPVAAAEAPPAAAPPA